MNVGNLLLRCLGGSFSSVVCVCSAKRAWVNSHVAGKKSKLGKKKGEEEAAMVD